MDSWIQTYTGIGFDPLDPRPSAIDLRDIAHSLAHLCRFNGHTPRHYSVAQHSVLVSRVVPMRDAAHALLHDAAEAYVSDWPAPLKMNAPVEVRDWFAEVEEQCWLAIAERFGLELDIPESVHDADLVLLATECRDVMGGERGGEWGLGADPMDDTIFPWDAESAERIFLREAVKIGITER